MDETKRRATPAEFSAWLRDQFETAGYRLSERGEQARLARDSGFPSPTLTRMLSGTVIPEIKSLQQCADFLKIPLGEVLVHAGVLTYEEVDRVRTRRPATRPMTTAEALDELKITDPGDRSVVAAVIETVKKNRADSADGAERAAE
ncbi:XRE family transcriptional regulator [Streptomyces sp. WAC01280]|uniref:XRE family transcriptional regulator n=1 Tax=Streptomyces sp. WAC01280 TaxID=2487424 RepID=UPI000F79772F|nr:XRE family transcriptional regulator [Streptomyces sp. WAC01280]RSS59544.1 XRE family transcriptional regulator [Streptomyces sp. WAC01280]